MALSVSIDLLSSSARVTSVKFQKHLVLTDGRTSGPKDRTPGLPGSDKKSLFHGILLILLFLDTFRIQGVLSFPLFPDTSTELSAAGAKRGVCNERRSRLGRPANTLRNQMTAPLIVACKKNPQRLEYEFKPVKSINSPNYQFLDRVNLGISQAMTPPTPTIR